jgi:hypothetical protein
MMLTSENTTNSIETSIVALKTVFSAPRLVCVPVPPSELKAPAESVCGRCSSISTINMMPNTKVKIGDREAICIPVV